MAGVRQVGTDFSTFHKHDFDVFAVYRDRHSLEPTESIEAILRLVDRSTVEDSGKFFAYTGKELPW